MPEIKWLRTGLTALVTLWLFSIVAPWAGNILVGGIWSWFTTPLFAIFSVSNFAAAWASLWASEKLIKMLGEKAGF